MAYIRADGHEIPFVLAIGEERHAVVSLHLLHVRFGFVQSTIYVEEEVMSSSGCLKEYVHVVKLELEEGHVWHLRQGRYQVYGLSLLMMGDSIEILPRRSDHSTVDMPLGRHCNRNSTENEHITPISLHRVKQEVLDPVIGRVP
jgi:hypothetical protein